MSLGAADQEDLARWQGQATVCRRQCGRNLEDPDAIRIGATVERENPGYSQRARGNINARGEGLPSYIRGEGDPYRWPSTCVHGVVIRHGQVTLGRHGSPRARAREERARYCSWWKPSYRGSCPYANISRNVGGTGGSGRDDVGNGGAGQNSEGAGCSHPCGSRP